MMAYIVTQYLLVSIIIIIAIFAELAIEAIDDDGSYEKSYLLRLLISWYKWVFEKRRK